MSALSMCHSILSITGLTTSVSLNPASELCSSSSLNHDWNSKIRYLSAGGSEIVKCWYPSSWDSSVWHTASLYRSLMVFHVVSRSAFFLRSWSMRIVDQYKVFGEHSIQSIDIVIRFEWTETGRTQIDYLWKAKSSYCSGSTAGKQSNESSRNRSVT